jgi:predicted nuclease of predicted toxin-antitoxin system
MNLYLDDDSINPLLVKFLRADGHDVQLPANVGLAGKTDPAHLRYSIKSNRVLLSHNHDDFQALHYLVTESTGHHPGILMVRRDNDVSRDLTPRGIALAVNKIAASGMVLRDKFQIVNQWR